MTNIKAEELLSRMQKVEPLNLLDVREEIEYHTYNIGGKNVPLSKLEYQIEELGWNKTDEIIVICHIGLRSKTAQSILKFNGYQDVRNLTGGLIALKKIQ